MFFEFVKENSPAPLKLYSGVKGLVSHGDELRSYLDANKPEILLVSVSQEEIEGLREFLKAPFEMNLSDYEIIYGVRLSVYGEVMTPPPIYTECVIYASSTGSSVVGIDMTQDEFNEVYTRHMKPRHLVRHSLRKKRILHHDFKDTNEYEFAERWIERINSVRGLGNVDRERAAHMATRIDDFSRNEYRNGHLIVTDHEFFRALSGELSRKGWEIRKA